MTQTHPAIRALIVEDSENDATLLVRELRRGLGQLESQRVENLASMRAALEASRWDVVISDWSLPGFSGSAALGLIKEMGIDVPFIIVSGQIGEEAAVEAMRAGAHDYVLKDRLARLVPAVERGLREKKVREERRRAEDELRASEQRYRRIIETTSEGIWLMDADFRTTFVNDKMAKMLGYTPGDMVGMHLLDFMSDEARRLAESYLDRRQRGIGEQRDFGFRRKNGSELWTSLVINPIMEDDRYVGALAMVTDVTEKRRHEAIQARSAELEEQNRRIQTASRLKSEFLANMSHELRTPLNAIIGFAELMKDERVGPMDPQHKEFVGDILTSGRHLLALINDVLDLAKVESGKMEFRPEPVHLAKVVGEVSDVLRTMAAMKRIRVALQIEPLENIVTDPSKLKQILYNYLSNALKFTPEEGHVTVRVAPETEHTFRISVEDTGIGIRESDLSRLFIEFHQLDSTTSKKYPGTGLGLALTKRIVEAQGGRVEVESEPDRGSTFSAVLLRDISSDSQRSLTASHTTTPAEASKILVIEDNDEERLFLVRSLTDAGYSVQSVATGAKALMRCREETFDAITLDILLPDMSGADIMREMRAGGLNKDTPVIVVTVVTKGAVAGFAVQDVLEKPISAEDLLVSLTRARVEPRLSKTVLVLDDDSSALRLMTAELTQLGLRTVALSDGAEALTLIQSEPPAAIVLDLLMPAMDGMQFLARLRAEPWGRNIPVIVWTVKDLSTAEKAKILAMAQALVTKGDRAGGSVLEELRAQGIAPRRVP